MSLVTSAAPGHFRIRAVQLTNVDQRFLIGLCCRTFSWWVALAAPLSCTGRPAADPLLVFLLPPLHWIIPSCGGFFWISARIIFLFCCFFFLEPVSHLGERLPSFDFSGAGVGFPLASVLAVLPLKTSFLSLYQWLLLFTFMALGAAGASILFGCFGRRPLAWWSSEALLTVDRGRENFATAHLNGGTAGPASRPLDRLLL